ncbi:MAG: hypothetical protein A3F67_02370 [Verrucomicrobia bacterium RIFCSPHIGHO2_12_FULL_41_10]|nr:MAG: hypothetical protein A3F67_02370 [Verrucomicrobia bacterium RIFCSPHIGHO2_12_FULL_41_10]
MKSIHTPISQSGHLNQILPPKEENLNTYQQSNLDNHLRKVVGRRIEDLSIFDRIRQLQSSLNIMGIKQKNESKHIRRTVGAAFKKPS